MATPTKEIDMSDTYAFPRYRNCLYHEESGMTLRDYLAAKVLPAVYDTVFMDMGKNGFVANWEHGIAQDAYAMADAMLEARK